MHKILGKAYKKFLYANLAPVNSKMSEITEQIYKLDE